MKHKSYRQGQNKHHLKPKSRGGQTVESNLLWIKIDRHKFWHKIFGNKTLDEVINLLCRLKNLKEAQKNYLKN